MHPQVVIEKLDAFLVMVVKNPTQRDIYDEGATPTIVVQPTGVLAKDDKQASAKAMRLVPEEHGRKIDLLEVMVLPFDRVG